VSVSADALGVALTGATGGTVAAAESDATNGCERCWSPLKESMKGTYVSVEPIHPCRYLDEQPFRFNQREGDDADRFMRTLSWVTGRRVKYDRLTSRPVEA